MDYLLHTLHFILHIDQSLLTLVNQYGPLTYLILFLIIFCETGLVITPILPGDSLLFAAGAIAAHALNFNVHLLFLLLVVASILGNSLNYVIGRFFGQRLFQNKIINPMYYDKAYAFYEKFGGKTIVIARFIPIVRTFAPFVAGIANMRWQSFSFYNVIGAALWIGTLTYLGWFCGNIALVKNNFAAFILGLIALSFLPAIIEIFRQTRLKQHDQP